MKRITVLTLLLLIFAAPSCVVTDVGNPEEDKSDVTLDFSGYAQTQTSALTLSSEVEIDTAWLVLSQFRFLSEEECDAEDGRFDATQPVVIDLLADEPTYTSPMFTKPSGEYCKLDVGFASVQADALPQRAPAELAGLSVLVEGARADGVEFRIEATFDDLFHLNGLIQSFKLEPGEQHLILGFALDEWINEAKLGAIRGEDLIVITSETHPEMLADFSASVKRSAELFRDRNDNRKLDASEKGQAIASSAQGGSSQGESNRPDHAGE